MSSPVTDEPARTHRATLVHDQFLSEYGGRHAAGTVVLVDDRTYRRWLDKGIARPSEETDRTLREQKLARLAALQAEIDAIGDDAPAAGSITRSGGVEARRDGHRAKAPA